MTVRSTPRRIDDAQRRSQSAAAVWIAAASSDGVPHLVPFSLDWDGSALQFTTPDTTVVLAQFVEGEGRVILRDDSSLA